MGCAFPTRNGNLGQSRPGRGHVPAWNLNQILAAEFLHSNHRRGGRTLGG